MIRYGDSSRSHRSGRRGLESAWAAANHSIFGKQIQEIKRITVLMSIIPDPSSGMPSLGFYVNFDHLLTWRTLK